MTWLSGVLPELQEWRRILNGRDAMTEESEASGWRYWHVPNQGKQKGRNRLPPRMPVVTTG